jgi:predicted site-specific integrase-resolvase
MRLAEWARQQGVSYQTAYRWFRTGILPVPSKQLPTGTILVEPVPLAEKLGAAVYARVSSGDQNKDLERQLARLVEHATASGLSIVKSVSEVGSGVNGDRRKLSGLLRDPRIGAIVSRRDRVAHAARRRPDCSTTRSPAAPALANTARPVIPPPPAGAIPAREPSSALFGGRLGQWG